MPRSDAFGPLHSLYYISRNYKGCDAKKSYLTMVFVSCHYTPEASVGVECRNSVALLRNSIHLFILYVGDELIRFHCSSYSSSRKTEIDQISSRRTRLTLPISSGQAHDVLCPILPVSDCIYSCSF